MGGEGGGRELSVSVYIASIVMAILHCTTTTTTTTTPQSTVQHRPPLSPAQGATGQAVSTAGRDGPIAGTFYFNLICKNQERSSTGYL